MQISWSIFLSTASLLYTSAVLANIPDAATQLDGILRMPLRKVNKPDIVTPAHRKRRSIHKRDPFTTTLYNDMGTQYLVDISIGTPAQNFTVTLDTGSADLWVPGSLCPASKCPYGTFQESQSSTYKSLNKNFQIVYVSGSANGTYATDIVSIVGASVQNQQFGLASSTNSIFTLPTTTTSQRKRATALTNNGILGLGYPQLTAAFSSGQGPYNPFVFNLVSQKAISDPIFSIYTNTISQVGWVGEIIFGGIDSSKFSGNITYLPVAPMSLVKSGFNGDYFWMTYAQGVSVIGGSSSSSSSDNNNNTANINFSSAGTFIFDTGATFTYLPATIAQQIADAAFGTNGYVFDSSFGNYLVNCQAAQSTAKFELDMTSSSSPNSSHVTWSVPISQLIFPLDGQAVETSEYCIFGIAPAGQSVLQDNTYLIGDSILRSAYMVFDMGNNQIGFAPTVGTNGSSMQGMPSQSSIGSNTNSPAMLVLFSCLSVAVFMF